MAMGFYASSLGASMSSSMAPYFVMWLPFSLFYMHYSQEWYDWQGPTWTHGRMSFISWVKASINLHTLSLLKWSSTIDYVWSTIIFGIFFFKQFLMYKPFINVVATSTKISIFYLLTQFGWRKILEWWWAKKHRITLDLGLRT